MSKPSWPPNAIDFAIEPRTRPSAAITRNWTPISAAKSALEKVENILLKKDPNPFITRRMGPEPSRNPPANTVASPSEAQPSAAPNGARWTATTSTPAITVSAIEIPGTSATRSHASFSSKNRAASRPGTASNRTRAKTTQSVCPRLPKTPGWFA